MIYITKAIDIRRWQRERKNSKHKPDPKPNYIELENIVNQISEMYKTGCFGINIPALCKYNEIQLKKYGYKVRRYNDPLFPESKWVEISWKPTFWTVIKDLFTTDHWC